MDGHAGTGVYEGFEKALEARKRRYAGRSGKEVGQLCLLALEREQIVATAYREQEARPNPTRTARPPSPMRSFGSLTSRSSIPAA